MKAGNSVTSGYQYGQIPVGALFLVYRWGLLSRWRVEEGRKKGREGGRRERERSSSIRAFIPF